LIPIATFSIVAYDPHRSEWGVAVQSKFLACAALVSWARAPIGAVATQSYVNVAYGSQGLSLMSEGMSAAETIAKLTTEDEQRDIRQVGVVDHNGQAAAFTGAACYDWAGHIVGQGYACQGNILVPGTVEAMAQRFEQARSGDGELADWLVAALAAGQQAGGDRRGRQAAGVMVVRQGGGYGGNNDRYLDLRVDDDPKPIQKLQQLVEMHHLFFGEVDPDNLIPIAGVAPDLQRILQKTGHYNGSLNGIFDDTTRTALRALVGAENLEERWNGESDMIDELVVDFLREKFDKEDAA
jgi:uncharacterized Ntn-hydrolase superfamily protein